MFKPAQFRPEKADILLEYIRQKQAEMLYFTALSA